MSDSYAPFYLELAEKAKLAAKQAIPELDLVVFEENLEKDRDDDDSRFEGDNVEDKETLYGDVLSAIKTIEEVSTLPRFNKLELKLVKIAVNTVRQSINLLCSHPGETDMTLLEEIEQDLSKRATEIECKRFHTVRGH